MQILQRRASLLCALTPKNVMRGEQAARVHLEVWVQDRPERQRSRRRPQVRRLGSALCWPARGADGERSLQWAVLSTVHGGCASSTTWQVVTVGARFLMSHPWMDWRIGAFHDEETLLDYDFAMNDATGQSWRRLVMRVQRLRLRRQDAEVAMWSPPLARGSA